MYSNTTDIALLTFAKDWYIHTLHDYKINNSVNKDETYIDLMQSKIDWFTKIIEEKQQLMANSFLIHRDMFLKDEERKNE